MIDQSEMVMELVRTMGGLYKELIQRIGELEKKGATPEDIKIIKDITSHIHEHLEDIKRTLDINKVPQTLDKLLESVADVAQSNRDSLQHITAVLNDPKWSQNMTKLDSTLATLQQTVATWSKFWDSLISAKAIAAYIIAVILIIIGVGTTTIKVVSWVNEHIQMKESTVNPSTPHPYYIPKTNAPSGGIVSPPNAH